VVSSSRRLRPKCDATRIDSVCGRGPPEAVFRTAAYLFALSVDVQVCLDAGPCVWDRITAPVLRRTVSDPLDLAGIRIVFLGVCGAKCLRATCTRRYDELRISLLALDGVGVHAWERSTSTTALVQPPQSSAACSATGTLKPRSATTAESVSKLQ
jgi:sugar/nucleoside kinase (ribokinase family)